MIRILSFFIFPAILFFALFLPKAEAVSYSVIDTDPYGVWLFPSQNHVVRDSSGKLFAAYTLRKTQPPAAGWHIYAKSSSDNGAVWSSAVRTEAMPDSNNAQSLVIDQTNTLYEGWTFNVGAYVSRSLDGGATWISETALYDGGYDIWDWQPSIAVDGSGVLHAVFYAQYGSNDPPSNLYYSFSYDKGVSWSQGIKLTSMQNADASGSGATYPNIHAGLGKNLFILYDIDTGNGNSAKRLLHFDGTAWSSPLTVSSGATARWGDLAVSSDGTAHIIYHEITSIPGNYRIAYKTYNPATKTLSSSRLLTADSTNAWQSTIGVYSGNRIVAAYDTYNEAAQKYGGVYLLSSVDNFSTATRLSVSPEAKSPNLRSSFYAMNQPDKVDIVWIESDTTTATSSLVYQELSGILALLQIQAPQNFRYTLNSNQLTLNWDAATGATGYKIGMGLAAGNYSLGDADVGKVTSIGPIDVSAVSGTFYLAVKAYNSSQTSGYSNEILITITPATSGLQSPQNYSYTLNNNQLTLNWSAVAGATGYKVGLGPQAGSYSAGVYDVGNVIKVGPLDVTGVTGSYYSAVKAYSSNQESGYSNEKLITLAGTGSGDSITTGAITSTAISSSSYKEVVDPVSGFTFIFPNGGSGILSTANITSAPNAPASDGQGYYFYFDGTATVEVKIPFDNAGRIPGLLMFGVTEGCLDGGPAREQRWGAIPGTKGSDNSSLVFRLSQNSSVASNIGSRASQGTTGFARKAVWVNYRPASKNTQSELQLRTNIDWIISQLSDSLKANATNQYKGGLNFNTYNITTTESNGSAYSYGEWLQIPSFEFDDNSNDATYAHEGGHYINHLLLRARYGDSEGNTRWWTIQGLAPEEGHLPGRRPDAGRRTVTEEYAFFTEHLIMGQLDTRKDIGWLLTYIKAFQGSDKPKDVDFPGIEGFGVTLLTSLLNTTGTIKDWEGKTADVPVIGRAVKDIFDVISQGAANINDLRSDISANLGTGEGSKLQVTAERLGWSYHGNGSVLVKSNDTLTAVTDARVQNYIKIGSVEYVASEATVNANGEYQLSRIFPGCSTLRAISGSNGTMEQEICVSWDVETTALQAISSIIFGQVLISKKYDAMAGACGPTVYGEFVIDAPGAGKPIEGSMTDVDVYVTSREINAIKGRVTFKAAPPEDPNQDYCSGYGSDRCGYCKFIEFTGEERLITSSEILATASGPGMVMEVKDYTMPDTTASFGVIRQTFMITAVYKYHYKQWVKSNGYVLDDYIGTSSHVAGNVHIIVERK